MDAAIDALFKEVNHEIAAQQTLEDNNNTLPNPTPKQQIPNHEEAATILETNDNDSTCLHNV